MKREQKEKLVAKYMPGIPKITDYQREWIRKETAHFIFVEKGDDGKHQCTCDRCGGKYEMVKTKHRAKMICPSCKKEMEIMHLWRNKSERTVDWIAIPRVIDSETLMLRYIYAERIGASGSRIGEVARIVMNTNRKTMHYFELSYDEQFNDRWCYSRVNYFAEYSMYYYRRQRCCLQAKPYRPTFKREINKLECFRYFPEYMEHVNGFYYLSDGLRFISYKAPLYEKLIKAGLNDLVEEDSKRDLHNFGIEYSTKEKSLLKMLGINRNQFRLLKENQTVKNFQYIRLLQNITQEYLDKLNKSIIGPSELAKIKKEYKLSIEKVVSYLLKAKCSYYEWEHYLSILKKMGYALGDEHYMFPKDFRKEDSRVTREYLDYCRIQREKEAKEKDKYANEMIAKISNGLRENKELMEFFSGSEGLQIFVPETAQDLRNEGMALHNCIGTYVDSVANGRSLLFFIRRIEDPTAPYVAMEYRNGMVVQCRYDYNRAVDDKKILDFTNALAQKLKEQKILVA